jgi:hypothetical protein
MSGVSKITGFHQDEEANWVAELSCGHQQHVRHRPPFKGSVRESSRKRGAPANWGMTSIARNAAPMHPGELEESSPIWNTPVQERRDGIIIHQISQLIKIATRHGMRSVVVISIHARSRGWF